MIIDSNFFIHDHDKAALNALKAIPGFPQVVKAFLKIWDEQTDYIKNMSSYLRISEKQLPEYYNMLPPICKKLGIEIPDLFLKLDVEPNAWTCGDTRPYIIITSGLLETMPNDLIPTVLAHECGHIVCRHTLYKTIGLYLIEGLLNGINIAANFIPIIDEYIKGINRAAMFSIELAWFYWSRCSEFSADRAAIVCDGSADKMMEACMRFAGLDKDIKGKGNIKAFIEQSEQYKDLINDDIKNRMMEFYMFRNNTHPLNAVRAYECNEWQKSESYGNILKYTRSNIIRQCEKLPLAKIPEQYIGKDYLIVKDELKKIGFSNIELIRKTAESKKSTPSQVVEIAINGKTDFEDADWYPRKSTIEITYYLPETEEEIAAAHPGQIQIPNSAKEFKGKDYNEAIIILENIGFTNVAAHKGTGKKGIFSKENSISRITINGHSQFNQGDWIDYNAAIRITYNSYST